MNISPCACSKHENNEKVLSNRLNSRPKENIPTYMLTTEKLDKTGSKLETHQRK
jgi:hypothetical protein